LVQFALLGSSNLEQYAILLTGHLRMLVGDPGPAPLNGWPIWIKQPFFGLDVQNPASFTP
jgi:hypothetical protein